MSWIRHCFLNLALAAVVSASAQNAPFAPTENNLSAPTSLLLPPTNSPVDFFRQLLAMSPEAQDACLTNRSPVARARILAKLAEYQALNPDERELRLRATELRWWLLPLLQTPASERATRLAKVPTDLRELVESRLTQWTILPPPLQNEILNNEKALHYFALVETSNPPAASLQQQRFSSQFNQFFELTPDEKEQTLNTLSETERAQMQATLQSFEKLPPQQRITCVRNYAKFASMNEAERTEFLKNAESWSKMSPRERQTWRDLVATVPIWPPMPPGMVEPPAPPPPTLNVATNLN